MEFQENVSSLPRNWRGVQSVASKRAKVLSRSAVGILETVIVVFALFMLTEPIFALLHAEDPHYMMDSSQGDPTLQAIFLFVYGIVFITFGWKQFLPLLVKEKWIAVLLGLAVISALWSEFPYITLRRSVALFGTTMYGMYLAVRYSFRQILKFLAWATAIATLASILFALAVPKYGLMQEEYAGAWRGIYDHKNVLARIMVLGALSALLLALGERKKIYWGLYVLCMGVMGMTRSMTGLLLLIALTGLAIFLHKMQRSLKHGPKVQGRAGLLVPIVVFCLLLACGGGVWVYSNAKSVLPALGREKTLTGRTDLWRIAVLMIKDRPWWGYGYAAFWVEDSRTANDFWTMARWKNPTAHNGFLDLGLELGLAGVLAFLLAYLVSLRRAAIWTSHARNWSDLWPMLFLICYLLSNLTESVMVRRNNIFWVLFVATTTALLLKKGSSYDASNRLARVRTTRA